jgi:3-oxoacyl-[acyl-carrier protein] reductase
MDLALKGRVALVTGGSRGIGRAVSRRLGQEGAAVVVNYVRDADAAAETAREIQAAGSRVMAVKADVSRRDEVDHMVQQVQDLLGPVDILVNNAGGGSYEAGILDISQSGWDLTIGINLTGAFHCIQAVISGMMERGYGRIVNISSIAALGFLPNFPHYCAAKAGLIGLTKAVAKEVVHKGVTVNAVCPGTVLTDLLGVRGMTVEEIQGWHDRHPRGRCASPDDIAPMVAFLCSDLSAHVTGEVVNISGGEYV